MAPDCTLVETLMDSSLRSFLEAEAKELKNTITESELAKGVDTALKMDMSVKSAKGHMNLLSMEYKSIFRINGPKCVTEKALKKAVRQVLSVTGPAQLRTLLEQNMSFTHNHLNVDCVCFMEHAIDVSEAFKKVYSGSSRPCTTAIGEEIKSTASASTT